MARYTVLWLDDKHDELESVREDAEELAIDLVGHSNAEDGLEELKSPSSRKKYDAVLLDGKFWKTSEEEGAEALGNSAFVQVVQYLKHLKSQNEIIPWFVLSGQPNFVLDQDDWIDELLDRDFARGRIFDKSVDQDMEDLCAAIKEASNKLPGTIIKHKYSRVFDLCDKKYLGESSFDSILDLATDLENDIQAFNTKDKFTAVRKVIEKLLHSFGRLGFIPSEIIEQPGWLNKSSSFLSQRTHGYVFSENHIHPLVSHQIWNLLRIAQDASHVEGALRLDVDHFVTKNDTFYLYKSTIYQLFDILVWFKGFADANPNLDANRSSWKKSAAVSQGDWIKGTLKKIQENGYGSFVPDGQTSIIPIHPDKISEYKLIEGQKIQITTKLNREGTSTFAKQIKIESV